MNPRDLFEEAEREGARVLYCPHLRTDEGVERILNALSDLKIEDGPGFRLCVTCCAGVFPQLQEEAERMEIDHLICCPPDPTNRQLHGIYTDSSMIILAEPPTFGSELELPCLCAMQAVNTEARLVAPVGEQNLALLERYPSVACYELGDRAELLAAIRSQLSALAAEEPA